MPVDEKDPKAAAKAEDDKDEKKEGEGDMTRAALEAAAEGDENDPRVKAAKRALAAYDAEGDDKEPSAKADDADAKALTPALLSTIKEQGLQIQALTAESNATKRAAVFAKYPHAPAAIVAALKDAPLAQVEAVLGALPADPASAPPPPHAFVTTLARPPAQGRPGNAGNSPHKAMLDEAFGLVKYEKTVEMAADGVRQSFGVNKVISNG